MESNTWASFFGPLPTDTAKGPLPEAYYGKNTFMRDVIMSRVLETRMGLPFRAIPDGEDGPEIVWDEIHFDHQLLGPLPEGGVDRVVTGTITRDHMVRYGLSMCLDYGFATTEAGRKSYKMNIEEIRNAILETASVGVLHAYMRVKPWTPPQNLAEASFGLLQKPHGTRMLLSIANEAARKPDLLIVPCRAIPFVDAEAVARAGLTLKAAPLFSFPHVLSRETCLGEYYLAADDVELYDFSENRIVTMTVEEMLQRTGLFQDDGTPVPHCKIGTPADGDVPRGCFLKRCGEVWGPMETVGEVIGVDHCWQVPVSLSSVADLIRARHLGVVLKRPDIKLNTASAILAVSGTGTGETLIGHTEFSLDNNAFQKMHYGKFTILLKSIIYQQRNVTVINDAVVVGYQSGGALSDVTAEIVPWAKLKEPQAPLMPGFCRGGRVADVVTGGHLGSAITAATGVALCGMGVFA